MIKFGNDSWHRRFISFMGGRAYHSNLCPYVRSLVWAILKFTVFVAGGLLGVFLIGSILSAPFRDGFSKEIVILGTILWIMICLFSLVGGFFFAYAKLPKFQFVMRKLGHGIVRVWALITRQKVLTEYDGSLSLYRPFRSKWDKTQHEPSLIGEWFRSVHDKMCPQISFETKDSNDETE